VTDQSNNQAAPVQAEEGGINLWLIIVIIVVILVILILLVLLFRKKKDEKEKPKEEEPKKEEKFAPLQESSVDVSQISSAQKKVDEEAVRPSEIGLMVDNATADTTNVEAKAA